MSQFGRVPAVDVGSVQEDGLLLDVREPEEWAAGRAAAAVHIPMGEIVTRFGEVGELAADRRVFVICRSGGRSAQVTQYLVGQGLDAVNVDGGMVGWEASGRPMVADAGPPAVR